MPIYEYKCQSCQHELEALQKVSDAPLVDCPDCGQPALRKKVSAAAFRLKGGGWYETDFKKDGQKNLASGDNKSSEAGKESKAGKDGGDKPAAGKDKPAKKSDNTTAAS
jgi:putative FmdB family regulatory protein